MNPLRSRQLAPCILLFVKAPVLGQVKTRLGQSVGDVHAVGLYHCFVQDILATVDSLGVDTLIFFSPADALPVLKAWLGVHRTYFPQQGGDLGDRMAAAFRTCFAWGYRQALILGSDSPDLPRAILQEALDALARNQRVIGPSQDGGYYTLGLTANHDCFEIFQAIPWSTAAVYELTLERLQDVAQELHILPTWYDIDTVADLQHLLRGDRLNSAATCSLAYIQEHGTVLFQSDVF